MNYINDLLRLLLGFSKALLQIFKIFSLLFLREIGSIKNSYKTNVLQKTKQSLLGC